MKKKNRIKTALLSLLLAAALIVPVNLTVVSSFFGSVLL